MQLSLIHAKPPIHMLEEIVSVTMTVTGDNANTKGMWRRKKTLMKKAFELGTFPGVDVAVFVYKRGRLDTFMSTDRTSWPPTKEEIVSDADTTWRI